MRTILMFIHIAVSLTLIGLVLLQHGRGADAGAAFGSGASQSLFGARGSSSFLTRATAILAAVFFTTSLTLAYLSGQVHQRQSVTDLVAPSPASNLPTETTPKAPAEPTDLPTLPTAPQTPAKATEPAKGAEPAAPVAPAPAAPAAPAPAVSASGVSADLPMVLQVSPQAPVTPSAPIPAAAEQAPATTLESAPVPMPSPQTDEQVKP
ncbi:preprotein translocase subunit SecG [Gammaproteobacteria bacterium]